MKAISQFTIAAFVALSSGVLHAEVPDTGFVTVRATPGLPASVIEYIARVGQSQQFELPANQSPEEVIAAACGATTNSYLAVYDSLNAADVNVRAKLPRKRWPRLPACIQWEQRGVTVTVEPGNTLDSVLLEYIGRDQKARFTCLGDIITARCNKTFREIVQEGNKGEDLDNLRPGAVIQLPFKTVRTTFRVDPRTGLTAEEVVAEISKLGQKSAADSPIIQVDVGQPVRLISPVGAEDPDISNLACSTASLTAKSQGRPWPYDAALVARVLARNAARAKELNQAITPVTVTVIDTGLDPSFVPEPLLSGDGTVPGNPYGSSYIKNRSIP